MALVTQCHALSVTKKLVYEWNDELKSSMFDHVSDVLSNNKKLFCFFSVFRLKQTQIFTLLRAINNQSEDYIMSGFIINEINCTFEMILSLYSPTNCSPTNAPKNWRLWKKGNAIKLVYNDENRINIIARHASISRRHQSNEIAMNKNK